MLNNKYSFKYIIIGDSGVGKSCIMMRFTDKRFETLHDLTIGVEFGTHTYQIDNNEIKLQIWDTAGQESFRSITRAYYRGAIVAIIVFDVTKRKSFDNIMTWYRDVIDNRTQNTIIVLVGNKIDMDNERQVSHSEAYDFASKNNIEYFETSAKDDINVNDLFYNPAKEVYLQIKNKTLPEDHFISGKKIKIKIEKEKKNKPNNCEC